MREPLKPDQADGVGSALHRDSGRLMNALKEMIPQEGDTF